MSDKQLTVAELMARAAQEGSSPRESRPRRRRSLDEGGVSVAELTGSIPRVNKKPAESKHSSVPLDAPQERVQEKVAASVDSATSDTMVGAAAGASGGMREAHREPARPAPQPPQPVMPEPAPAAATTAQDTSVADTSDDVDDLDDSLTDDEETMVLSVVTEDDPVRLTTGSFPALTAELLADEEDKNPAPYGATDNTSSVGYRDDRDLEDDALTDNEGSGAEDEEIVTKVVFAGDNLAGSDGYDASEEYADQDYADEDFADESIESIAPVEDALPDRYDSEELDRVDESAYVAPRAGFATGTGTGTFEKVRTGSFTGQFPEVSDDVEDAAAEADDNDAVRGMDSAAFRAVSVQEDADADSELSEFEEDSFGEDTDAYSEDEDAFDPDFNDEDAYDEDDELDEAEADDNQKVSVLSIVLMVIIAIAVGVGLFKGFEMLWARRLPMIVTALLAVAATGGIVGIVHALRTERDGLSMVLAGIAGLVVTFGPLAIVAF